MHHATPTISYFRKALREIAGERETFRAYLKDGRLSLKWCYRLWEIAPKLQAYCERYGLKWQPPARPESFRATPGFRIHLPPVYNAYRVLNIPKDTPPLIAADIAGERGETELEYVIRSLALGMEVVVG